MASNRDRLAMQVEYLAEDRGIVVHFTLHIGENAIPFRVEVHGTVAQRYGAMAKACSDLCDAFRNWREKMRTDRQAGIVTTLDHPDFRVVMTEEVKGQTQYTVFALRIGDTKVNATMSGDPVQASGELTDRLFSLEQQANELAGGYTRRAMEEGLRRMV